MRTFQQGSRVHFIGIAGSGMNGIAKILISRGFRVSGSDEQESAVLRGLAAAGATTFVGHHPAHIEGVDLVVISSAIPDTNVELLEARARGVEVIRRAEALARLLPGRFSIAVAGTHGKTTTSGMFAQLLSSMGREPSFVIGSNVRALGVSALEGAGPEFIVEADESDGSFLHYRPNVAIITNIELDHVDHFSTLAEVKSLFTEFITTVRDFVVLCGDDPVASTIEPPASVRRITYGTQESCELFLFDLSEDEGISAQVRFQGTDLGRLALSMPGRHNLLDAAAVLATALIMGLDGREVMARLREFAGTDRRFEWKGSARGVTVLDDYGHHPTEIRAVIEAARSRIAQSPQQGRLALLFQPHRFSRTAAFAADFVDALAAADKTFMLDIYGAGENKIPGVTSKTISESIPGSEYCPDTHHAISAIKSWAQEGDVVITLGAGDVTKVGPALVAALAEEV